MLRWSLMIYGVLHAGIMAGVTIWASLQKSILENGHLVKEPWFIATITDTYLGFLLFFLWVCCVERRLVYRVVWAVLICGLGNIVMGLFIVIRAYRFPTDVSLRTFLTEVYHD